MHRKTASFVAVTSVAAALFLAPSALGADPAASLIASSGNTTQSATVDPVNVSTGGDPDATVATGSRGAAMGRASTDDTAASAEVGCVSAGAASGETSADGALGSCASGDSDAASLVGSSDESTVAGTVGCIQAGGSGADTSAGGSVGSCAAGRVDAATAAGSSEEAAAGGTIGCIGAGGTSADASASGSIGSCPDERGVGGAGGPGTDTTASGGGGAGALGGQEEGRQGGTLARIASAELPYTGLPVWILALVGLLALGAGVFMRVQGARPERERIDGRERALPLGH